MSSCKTSKGHGHYISARFKQNGFSFYFYNEHIKTSQFFQSTLSMKLRTLSAALGSESNLLLELAQLYRFFFLLVFGFILFCFVLDIFFSFIFFNYENYENKRKKNKRMQRLYNDRLGLIFVPLELYLNSTFTC